MQSAILKKNVTKTVNNVLPSVLATHVPLGLNVLLPITRKSADAVIHLRVMDMVFALKVSFTTSYRKRTFLIIFLLKSQVGPPKQNVM